MKIVLIGFMCSGKSKVGRLLSSRLGWPHVDTDEMIKSQVGKSIADIIRFQGEPAFRDIERKAVSLVSLMDKCVISTGGGVPLNPENMNDLSQDGLVFWLSVSAEVVLRRAGNFQSRPLIDPNNPLGSIQTRLDERNPLYEKAAQHRIDTDALTSDDVVEKILSLLPAAA